LQFHRGDRVRLTRRAAEMMMRSSKRSVEWLDRKGTVKHTTNPGSSSVLIEWDDISTLDGWPKEAVELDKFART
jgi:hypothetical protein